MKRLERLTEQMRAYDKLGPLTRKALGSAPRDINIQTMLVELRQYRTQHDRELDAEGFPKPIALATDKEMAAFIERRIKEIMPEWKPLLEPRKLKRSRIATNRGASHV